MFCFSDLYWQLLLAFFMVIQKPKNWNGFYLLLYIDIIADQCKFFENQAKKSLLHIKAKNRESCILHGGDPAEALTNMRGSSRINKKAHSVLPPLSHFFGKLAQVNYKTWELTKLKNWFIQDKPSFKILDKSPVKDHIPA